MATKLIILRGDICDRHVVDIARRASDATVRTYSRRNIVNFAVTIRSQPILFVVCGAI
jgi:hypothetical protein